MRGMGWRFLHSHNGSITVEFSIVIILFLFIILSCAEIARLLYISASLDFVVSEAAKSAKNKLVDDSKTYQEVFQEKLMAQQGVLGLFISDNNSVIVNVTFSNGISDIVNNVYLESNQNAIYRNEVLARYTVSYLYRPILFPISSQWANTLLKREVIFVQES
jgi:tight adherence protein E